MKRLFLASICLLFLALVGLAQGQVPLRIREVDGAPARRNPREIVFPNGTLGIGESGVVTYTPAGGGSGDALVADPLSQFASTTSAQFFGVISNETGTGVVVGSASPTFTGTVTIPVQSLTNYVQFAEVAAPAAGAADTMRLYAIDDGGTTKLAYKDSAGVETLVGAGGGTWGTITGTLADQTDLQTALDAKAATALSNLASVAVNTSLLPASNQSLGSATLPWLSTFTGTTTQYESVVSSAGLITYSALGSATNIGFVFTPKGTGGLSNPGAGANSERFGRAAVATGARATVLGDAPNAGSNTDTVLIGNNPTGNGGFSVGIGPGAVVAAGAVAIGYNPSANVAQAIAIGNSSVSNGGVTLGRASSGSAATTVIVGSSNTSTASTATVLIGDGLNDGGVAMLLIGGWFKNAAGVAEVGNGTIGQWGSLKVGVRDAGTATVLPGLYVGRQSTGTPAAGFGPGLTFRAQSSTTDNQDAAQISAPWTTATHASRTADLTISLVNNAAALAEVFRVKASGLIVLPQTVTAGGDTGNKTIQTMVGTVNLAGAASSVTVTNAAVSASSQVLAMTRTNDTTCSVKNVVPGAGSFVITMTAACNAETSVGWWIINQ